MFGAEPRGYVRSRQNLRKNVSLCEAERGIALVSDKSLPQSKNERLAIAAAIQHHLDAHGLARKDLIRDYLSKSTIDKLFQGEFSERTLTKIEAILKISLTSKPGEDDQAPGQFGGYTLQAVEYMQGDYLCVRPMFTHPTNLSAYVIRIVWDRGRCRVCASRNCPGPISNMPRRARCTSRSARRSSTW